MPGKRKRSANGRGGETGAEILAQKAAPGQVELQNKLYTWVKNNLHEDGASHTILQKLRTGELQKMGLYLLRESECSRTQIVSALQEIEPLVLERRPIDNPKRQTILTNLDALWVGVRDAEPGDLRSFREGEKKPRAEEVREAALGAAREQQLGNVGGQTGSYAALRPALEKTVRSSNKNQMKPLLKALGLTKGSDKEKTISDVMQKLDSLQRPDGPQPTISTQCPKCVAMEAPQMVAPQSYGSDHSSDKVLCFGCITQGQAPSFTL